MAYAALRRQDVRNFGRHWGIDVLGILGSEILGSGILGAGILGSWDLGGEQTVSFHAKTGTNDRKFAKREEILGPLSV